MKITVQHLNNSFNRSYQLKSPGATFGRSHDNQIVLPDPLVSVSLFQAAIKLNKAGQIVIHNLAATPILVNNQSLFVGQSFELQTNSEFSCGNFKFQLEAIDAEKPLDETTAAVNQAENQTFKAPTVMPIPGNEPIAINLAAKENATSFKVEESPAATPTASIFDDLFNSNGVIPIGAEVNSKDMHPFELNSAALRNTSDPLAQINSIDLNDDISKDPLERLSRDGSEHLQRDIFYDTRPSTLLHDDIDKIFNELENFTKDSIHKNER